MFAKLMLLLYEYTLVSLSFNHEPSNRCLISVETCDPPLKCNTKTEWSFREYFDSKNGRKQLGRINGQTISFITFNTLPLTQPFPQVNAKGTERKGAPLNQEHTVK